MAIAIRPAHTEHDGDTAYALATGEVEAPMNLLLNLAAEVVAEAIRNDLAGKSRGEFRYRDKGQMATIGRNSAIVEIGRCGSTTWTPPGS